MMPGIGANKLVHMDNNCADTFPGERRSGRDVHAARNA
jgi:hypothetical protein